jgi:sialic acid synthase SpsE
LHTLVIAEPGCTWDRDLTKAYQLIEAAKECGADVCKFQWTSDGAKIQQRRKVDRKYAAIYERGVQYPREWLEMLKNKCDSVGIEFACTCYLPEDIPIVADLVKRFKVSAYESQDEDFVRRHVRYDKEIIISVNPSYIPPPRTHRLKQIKLLHCISKYPAKLEELQLSTIRKHDLDGFSDHSANEASGSRAVAAGAQIVEAHIKLRETPKSNPDYAHSLTCETVYTDHLVPSTEEPFRDYVRGIRAAEVSM